MKTSLRRATFFTLITFMFFLSTAAEAQNRAYRASDREVQTLLDRIENRTNDFKNEVDRTLDRSNADGTFREDSINSMVTNFENATDRLKSNFSSRRSTSSDVQEVMNRAVYVNSFMRNNRMTQTLQNRWNQIRTDLNTLAGYYRVSSNWNDNVISTSGQGGYNVSDTQLKNLLDQLGTHEDSFRQTLDRWGGTNWENQTASARSLSQSIAEFERALENLNRNYNRNPGSAGVEQVLGPATSINSFIGSNRTDNDVTSKWNVVRNDLNTLAGYYRVRPDWTGNTTNTDTKRGYYVSDAELRNLLDRLKLRGSAFHQSFDRWSRYSQRNSSDTSGDVSQSIAEFETALDNLNRNYNRNPGTASVEQVLRPSASINSFITANRTNTDVSSKWTLVRNDLNTLAGYYRVSWDWNNNVIPGNQFPGNQTGNFDSRITGTYRLNTAQSDNVPAAVERAIDHANYDANQHDRMHRNLERRLISPDTLTLEKRGQQVTMSSANAQSVTLVADGSAQTEASPNGRQVTTRVTATNRELTINYEGDRMNDYYVSFMPMNNGQLKVTRRVYLENQNSTVTVTSVYDKTSRTPQWNTADYPNPTGGNQTDVFLIPNNTSIVATLDTPLSTRTAKDGDRFSMTVTSPSQYSGAVIGGSVIGEKSGVVSGRANMSLSFDTIRTRDGRTYRFAGIVDQVRETNGNVVNVSNEGSIRDDSQTTKTVTRAGIGAVLGAIIGAIAGGGSGAAIGAGVGAGAGAGTVILQGRDNLELASGSQFNITATAPANVRSQ